jgi:hypothetical protein
MKKFDVSAFDHLVQAGAASGRPNNTGSSGSAGLLLRAGHRSAVDDVPRVGRRDFFGFDLC